MDGSCKTSTGVSLNDIQIVGPRLQRDLREILIRFRRHRYAVSADIKKMFRQVLLTPDQWNLQRIFWRPNKNGPVKEYQIVTVIYGLAAAPYLAVKAMLTGADEYESTHPIAVEAIRNDFYVDDLCSGADTETGVIELSDQVRWVLKQNGFELDKWRSNN